LSDSALNGTASLRLELIASPGLAVVIMAAHAAAAACFLTVVTGWHGVALSLLATALGGIVAWDRALLGSPDSPKVVEISRTGRAKCLFANGESAALQPLQGTAVTRYWVALRLNSRGRRTLLIVAGMLPPQALRLLRLWALWGKLPGVPSRQPAPDTG
jgi:hypothetical protein